MNAKHSQDCPIYNGRECDCNYREPVASAGNALSDAARDVLAERQRQISVEGWTPQRDDKYDLGQLARAGASYAAQSRLFGDVHLSCEPHALWPWDRGWWKPNSRRGMLVKAGALILAEIERLDRAANAALASQSTPAAPVVEQALSPRNAEMDDLAKAMHANPAFQVANVAADLRAALAQSTPHVPAGEPSPSLFEQRRAQGYAPGDYMGRCGRCGEIFVGDKRALTCEACADAALATPRPPEPAAPVTTHSWEEEQARFFGVATEDIPHAVEPAAPVAQWQTRETEEDEWENIDASDVEFCRTNRGYFVRPLYAAPTAALGLSDAEIKAVITDAVGFEWAGLWPVQSMNSSDLMNIARSLLSANRAAQETK